MEEVSALPVAGNLASPGLLVALAVAIAVVLFCSSKRNSMPALSRVEVADARAEYLARLEREMESIRVTDEWKEKEKAAKKEVEVTK